MTHPAGVLLDVSARIAFSSPIEHEVSKSEARKALNEERVFTCDVDVSDTTSETSLRHQRTAASPSSRHPRDAGSPSRRHGRTPPAKLTTLHEHVRRRCHGFSWRSWRASRDARAVSRQERKGLKCQHHSDTGHPSSRHQQDAGSQAHDARPARSADATSDGPSHVLSAAVVYT